MRKRSLAVLFISFMILASAIPLKDLLANSPNNSTSLSVSNSPIKFAPVMRVPTSIDKDHNGIADSLDQEIARRANDSSSIQDYASVTVMLKNPPTSNDTDAFVLFGGVLTTGLWENAIYGFGGRIPYSVISSFVKEDPNVLLVEEDAVGQGDMAYAAKQVGARPYVWNALGLKGDSNSSIAVLDTGIDASSPDFSPGYGDLNFSDKIVGWNDQITGSVVPFDDNGHGSHVSGIAAGDGFFSVDSSGYATATYGNGFGSVDNGGLFSQTAGVMVNNSGTITVKVKWAGNGSDVLSGIQLYYAGKSLGLGSQVASVSTPFQNAWYTLTFNVGSVPLGGYDLYHVGLSVTTGADYLYVVYTVSWPFIPPGDGFSAWTGIAPQSKLVGVKVAGTWQNIHSPAVINGIDWVIANRVAYHITVVSMSLGFYIEDAAVDAAVVSLVNSGVSVVVSTGNAFGSGVNNIFSPRSVDEAITVSAMNQFDDIASYANQGGPSNSDGKTIKPDITAPGGSFLGAPIFSADSNTNDGWGGFVEVQPNDAAPIVGTSMAAPVVAGGVALVQQSLGGFGAWNWTRNQALTPKMILLMTATETYPNLRETYGSSDSPTLDRGGKDVHEGYGRLNIDASVDAVLKTYNVGTAVTDSLGLPPSPANIAVLGQRLAWARNVALVSGVQYSFSLNVPPGADYDLYLYNSTGTVYGEPVIVKSSTTAATGGFENLTYAPAVSGVYYIVVKRASEDTGAGQFILASWSNQTSVSIVPSSVNMTVGMRQTFNSTVSGGVQPYAYQWYLNGSQISNANSGSWTFTANSSGNSTIYLTVADNYTGSSKSNVAAIRVGGTFAVAGFNVQSGGSGYTTPALILSGGGGTGATATARVSNGVILGIVLTNPGIGYTSAPTVSIRDPSPRARGALATAVLATS